MKRWCAAVLPLGLGLLAAACGGGGSSPTAANGTPTALATPTPAPTPAPTPVPTPTPTPAPLSTDERASINATIAKGTQEILQEIIKQLTAAGRPGEVRVAESFSLRRDLSDNCTSGGAYFTGTANTLDETEPFFVNGQGTAQLTLCGTGAGTVVDGAISFLGSGHVPGGVSGTYSGDVSVYRVQPSGGLSLVQSNFGIFQNWACTVNQNGGVAC
jgi:hypothetical protein